MPSPILISNNVAINAVPMTANITSAVINVSDVTGVAVHFQYLTGTAPTGTLRTQGSNDGVNFVDVDTKAISATGQYLVNLPSINYAFLQLAYTFTSGTGSLTAYVSVKKFN